MSDFWGVYSLAKLMLFAKRVILMHTIIFKSPTRPHPSMIDTKLHKHNYIDDTKHQFINSEPLFIVLPLPITSGSNHHWRVPKYTEITCCFHKILCLSFCTVFYFFPFLLPFCATGSTLSYLAQTSYLESSKM